MHNPPEDWTSFAAWEERLGGPWEAACPFWGEPFTPQTRFLNHESTAPLPCCFYLGACLCAPEWRLPVAWLRHVVLPNAFGKYLCRNEWSDPHIPMPAEDLIEGARQAGWTEEDGLPVMQGIVETVDRALAAPGEAFGWPLPEEACRMFNEEWCTGSWDFALHVFPSLEAVIPDVTGVDEGESLVEDPDDPDDLGLLYARCFEDAEANRKLREYLREFVRMQERRRWNGRNHSYQCLQFRIRNKLLRHAAGDPEQARRKQVVPGAMPCVFNSSDACGNALPQPADQADPIDQRAENEPHQARQQREEARNALGHQRQQPVAQRHQATGPPQQEAQKDDGDHTSRQEFQHDYTIRFPGPHFSRRSIPAGSLAPAAAAECGPLGTSDLNRRIPNTAESGQPAEIAPWRGNLKLRALCRNRFCRPIREAMGTSVLRAAQGCPERHRRRVGDPAARAFPDRP